MIAHEFGGAVPNSGCGTECKLGQSKINQGDCCWVCNDCPPKSIVSLDGQYCEKCERTKMPNDNKTICVDIPLQYMEWLSVWSIGPLLLSFLGIAATVTVTVVFRKYSETPVIKASGRELCYFMLVGILSSYLITFFLLAKPSLFSCTILRVMLGFSLCMCYAAILTKTNRLARIFNSNVRSAMAPKYITPKFQLFLCSAICSVQLVAALIWFIIEPPYPVKSYPEDFVAVYLCHRTTYTLIVPLAYNGFLVIMCTIYAFKTRSIPESFNETKHIGFTMYSSCIVWAAFVPIYFGTKNFKIQITSLCMCISICATVKLCCFFAPKVYICIFEPDKNVRQQTLTTWRTAQMQFFNQQVHMMQMRTVLAQSAAKEAQDGASIVTDASIEPSNQVEQTMDVVAMQFIPPPGTKIPPGIEMPPIHYSLLSPNTQLPTLERGAKSMKLKQGENLRDLRKTSMPETQDTMNQRRDGLNARRASSKFPLTLPPAIASRISKTTSSEPIFVQRLYRRVKNSSSSGDCPKGTNFHPPAQSVLAVMNEDEGTVV